MEEQKSESMISGVSNDKIKAGKKVRSITQALLGIDINQEIWGGVGITCLDWSPVEPNLLAAVTSKTQRLEIWKVDKGQMIYIMDLLMKVSSIRWNPHNGSQLMALEKDKDMLLLIDYKMGTKK